MKGPTFLLASQMSHNVKTANVNYAISDTVTERANVAAFIEKATTHTPRKEKTRGEDTEEKEGQKTKEEKRERKSRRTERKARSTRKKKSRRKK